MRVEEEFEIEIGDEEAALCATAGQLCQLVALKLNVEPDFSAALSGCRSSAAFYGTRRDLMAFPGLSRREIRPKTPLSQIMEPSVRRQQWRQFQIESGANLPDLQLSEALNGAIILGVTLPWTLSFVSFAAGEPWVASALLLGGAAFLGGCYALVKPWARSFPASCQTVGDLSQRLMFSRSPASETPLRPSEAEVWQRVRLLIADEFSAPLETVTREADFVRDLGVG